MPTDKGDFWGMLSYGGIAWGWAARVFVFVIA